MRASRGMGAMRASKMPKGKTITRKDNPDKVKVFGEGGSTDDPLKDKTGAKQDPEYGDFVRAGPAKGVAKKKKPTPAPTRAPFPQKTGDKRDAELGDFVLSKAKGGKANWIKGAIKKPGALRSALGAKPGKPIPAGKLAKAAKAPGKLGQRARFAEVLRGMRKK